MSLTQVYFDAVSGSGDVYQEILYCQVEAAVAALCVHILHDREEGLEVAHDVAVHMLLLAQYGWMPDMAAPLVGAWALPTRARLLVRENWADVGFDAEHVARKFAGLAAPARLKQNQRMQNRQVSLSDLSERSIVSPGSGDVALQRVLLRWAEAEICALPEEVRHALHGTYLRDATQRVLAREAGCTQATISRRAGLGLALLRRAAGVEEE